MDQPVSHVMTRDLVCVNENSSIGEAERLLLAHRIHGAPVVDSRGRLAGIVSQTDLLRWHADEPFGRAHAPGGPAPSEGWPTVRDVMSTAAHAVRPETSAAVAAALMIRRKMHRLLVVDKNLAPVGIVTAIDLLRLIPGLERQLGRHRALIAGDDTARVRNTRPLRDGGRPATR